MSSVSFAGAVPNRAGASFFPLAFFPPIDQTLVIMLTRCKTPGLFVLILSTFLVVACLSCRTAGPPPAASLPARVALLSDLHVTRGTNSDVALYAHRQAQAIQAVNAPQVDLVLIAGDLTEHGTAPEYADLRRALRRFTAPVFYVPGNHDLGNKRLPGRPGGFSFARLRNYQIELGRSFYCRECAGMRVIGVNSVLPGSGLPAERNMWKLLETELAGPTNKPTLLLLHHPPFLKKADEPGGDYFNLEPYPRARLLALASQSGALAVLSGHLHTGLTNRVGKMVLLTTPPVSFGLPKNKQLEGWTLLTVNRTNVTWEFQPLFKP
jgi:3',5'-cyclic AMP phosphodiesterase CpdA